MNNNQSANYIDRNEVGLPGAANSLNPAGIARHASVRSVLTWLVLACLVPGVIGPSVVLYVSYLNERAQLEQDTIQTARALMQAVDADLSRAETAARSLSLSEHLASKDFAAFHAQATNLLQLAGIGNNVVLSDAAGQQLINTIRPFPGPLPLHGNPAQLHRVFETGKPVVSDVFIGGALHRPVMSIDVPVLQDRKVVYDLSIGLFPERLMGLLHAPHLPPDWIVGVYDSQGTVAARTHSPEKYVGHKAVAPFVRGMALAAEGIVETPTLEGTPSLVIFSRSAVSNWTVGISVPVDSFEAPLRHRFLILFAAVTILVFFGFAVAWLLAERIARSIRALIAPALALGSGEPVTVPSVYLKEVKEVGAAIAKASKLLALRSLANNVYENISDGILATDTDGNIVSVNPALCTITGYAAGDLVGANPRIMKSDRHEEAFYLGMEHAIRQDNRWQGEIWIRRKDGNLFLARATITAMRDDCGQIEHYIGVMSDITERKNVEEKIQQLAYFDSLTGLPNRRMLYDRLAQGLSQAKRFERSLAVMFLDLDNFKKINDTLGHDAGDDLLKEVALRLEACVRSGDTVARQGGDEFIIVLAEIAEAKDAALVAEKIVTVLSGNPAHIAGQDLLVTTSIGIAVYSVNGTDDAQELLKKADTAMYAAKAAGRNDYRFFES